MNDRIEECMMLAQNLSHISEVARQLKEGIEEENPNLEFLSYLSTYLVSDLRDVCGDLTYYWEKQGIIPQLEELYELYEEKLKD